MNTKFWILFLFFMLGVNLFAQGTWIQTSGPVGGPVNCIYMTENGDMFIGSNAGKGSLKGVS